MAASECGGRETDIGMSNMLFDVVWGGMDVGRRHTDTKILADNVSSVHSDFVNHTPAVHGQRH